eukprot:SAG31_NODE_11810_length_996_cov_0.966555_2_plen_88_part_00
MYSTAGRTRRENVSRMATAIFEGNGSARMVGERKWQAKQRAEAAGGLLFAEESIAAFKDEAKRRGVPFPATEEVQVPVSPVKVAAKL